MTDECCPSDFSRQRAFVVANSADVLLRAINVAVAALPAEPPLSSVERIVVQAEQLAAGVRPILVGESTALLDAARASLRAGDAALAADDLRELLIRLTRSE